MRNLYQLSDSELKIVREEELNDFNNLYNELYNEIKEFRQLYSSKDHNLHKFLIFYEDKITNGREKRKLETNIKRKEREDKEIEIRNLFKKTHECNQENIQKEKNEHLKRKEKEWEIRRQEDAEEESKRKMEDEMIKKIKNEMKEQKQRLIQQREEQKQWELDYIRRQREEHEQKEREEMGIVNLPHFPNISLPNKSYCTICLSDMQKGDIATILPCTHNFHDNCIREWLERHPNCPICKIKVI